MAAIDAFAKPQGLVVLEDAAQAHGARYQSERVGSLGTAAAFSFYPTENLGAVGDGGAVCTNDEVIAARLRRLRRGATRRFATANCQLPRRWRRTSELSLPMHPDLRPDEIEVVAGAVSAAVSLTGAEGRIARR